MFDTIEMTEEKAFEQDVRTMSYEELMATIRYLDAERCALSKQIHQDDIKKDEKTIGNHKENRETENMTSKKAA